MSAAAPSTSTPLEEPERLAVGFSELLRRSGLAVPSDASHAYAEALAAVGLQRRAPVYWAGRATLVRRLEDVAAYDRAFRAFFLNQRGYREQIELQIEPLTLLVDTGAEQAENEGPEGDRSDRHVTLRYSPAAVLRTKDFAACSDEELAEIHRLMASLRVGASMRTTHRLVRADRRGRHFDLRRTVRHAVRAGGEPVRRAYRRRGERPRRLVLLCDVSGSMEPYARALVRFLHVAVAERGRVEAFTLSTRLTRLTRELSVHDPDVAIARAARAVPDWSSGTRLGEALKQFNDRYGTRGLARGAIVVILSDGWDRGDPAALAEEMARLARVAHRIIWVNPLKATPGYSPLARGMAAALPYVDQFLEGHSLASLEALSAMVST